MHFSDLDGDLFYLSSLLLKRLAVLGHEVRLFWTLSRKSIGMEFTKPSHLVLGWQPTI